MPVVKNIMLKVYAMESGKRELVECDAVAPGAWINLENPSDKEIEETAAATGIPEDMLKAALDEEETARFERDEGNTLVLLDTPIITDSDEGDALKAPYVRLR